MEAIYLVCGARRPQLKRDPLGGCTSEVEVILRYVSRTLLGLAILAPHLSAQSSWDRYKPGSLAAIIGQEGPGVLQQFATGPGHHTVVSAEGFPTRATVLFLDSSRAITAEHRAVLNTWVKSLHVPITPDSVFVTEMLFREDTLAIWLPIQEVLLESFHRELKRDDTVTLLVAYVDAGGRETTIDWVFVVNEFQTP